MRWVSSETWSTNIKDTILPLNMSSTTSSTKEYTEALTNLSVELGKAYDDIKKKIDPSNLTKEVINLQTKIATATIDSMTINVKTFRDSLIG